MHVSHGANGHFPGKAEEPRGYNAMGNVRGQYTRSIRSNHRNLKRDKSIRERVEVTTSPAPGVGEAHIGPLANSIVDVDVSPPIICNPADLQRQPSDSASHIQHMIQKKELHRAHIKITRP